MKKIGFCIRDLNLGGIEKLLYELINSLEKEKKYEISLLTKEKTNTYLYNLIKKQVKTYYLIEKKESKNIFIKLMSSLMKKKRLKNFSKDLDLIIDFSNGDFYNYVRRIKQKKKVVFIHSSYNYLKETTPISDILSKYNMVISAGNGIYKELLNENIENLYNLDNMVDYYNIDKKLNENLEINFDINQEYFLTVCRLHEKHKDVKTLIEAFSMYEGKEKLVIVGDGQDRAYLENLSKEKGLTDRVIFLGALTNPFILMKNAKAFILSSKTEGFGLVLVEALYCGTKVISADCPVGPKEILENGEIGELFKVGDKKDLIDKLNIALNKKYDKEKIKNSLEKYSKERYLKKFDELINIVVNS